jgi:thioredoxin-dependent peroxiredoxin
VNKKFAESLSVDYPILSDPSKEVAKAYGVVHEKRPLPERWTYYIGPDGKILYIDKTVKAGTHGKDVAAKLKELGVKEKK